MISRALALDSARQTTDSVRSNTGIDTLIFYGADTTEGTLDNSTVTLRSNAWVRYQGMEIRAAVITINQLEKRMTASAVPDSVDSLGQVIRWRGIPRFSESGEEFEGMEMEYLFETRRGRVVKGRTHLQDGYYYGENIRKIGDNTLYIRHGRFTTCDVPDDPHFYFQTSEMKMIVKDKIVAKPVVLHIHEVPIFAIPFGVFPNKSGRASGITPPIYSETPREGRQVRNFGYYWAPNDYFDALGQVDFLDKAGFLFHGGTRYAKRYQYAGNFQGSYSALNYITGEQQRLWNIDAAHNQTISEHENLNATVHYVSSKNFYQFTSINPEQVLNRQIRTDVSYNNTQDWGALSANFSQSRNLDNGQRDLTAPNVNISKSSAALFPKSTKDRNKPDEWYQTIRYSINTNALFRQTQATGEAPVVSGLGANHLINVNAPFKVFKYLNVSPNLNVQETWFDRRKENFAVAPDNSIQPDTVRGFYARHTFSGSVGLSTKVYGTANPHLFGLETFRHVMSPSVSLTYQPDFSSRQWGYYESVPDTSGKKVRVDRYGGNLLLFGGTPQGRQLSMGFSLSHVLQAKFRTESADSAGTDEDVKLKKMDLLNWTNSINYNFEAQEFKLSNLSTGVSISPDLARRLSLSLSLTHDFYRYDQTLNRRVDKFRQLPKLVNASITSGFSLEGGDGRATARQEEPEQSTQNYSSAPFQQEYNQRFLPQPKLMPVNVPWSLRLNMNYDINRSNPSRTTKSFGSNLNANVKITPNWQATYSARYDVLKQKIVSQSFSFLRELHCWEMRFDWTPTGPTAGYFFIIQVRSSSLQDLKIQKTDYGRQLFN
ncbi:MAG: LPS-assembly protein LptD [Bacteroidetes bacterium]|nr:LPS-assembly protein LptD [Bacteroidota bacterium]